MMGEEDRVSREYAAFSLFINWLPQTHNLFAPLVSHRPYRNVKEILKRVFLKNIVNHAKKYLPARNHPCFHFRMKHQQMNYVTFISAAPGSLGTKEDAFFQLIV